MHKSYTYIVMHAHQCLTNVNVNIAQIHSNPFDLDQDISRFICCDMAMQEHCMINTGVYAEDGNFRVDPIFHPTSVRWNLGSTREFPTSVYIEELLKYLLCPSLYVGHLRSRHQGIHIINKTYAMSPVP